MLDLTRIDDMTAVEIGEWALNVEDPSEFWLLSGVFVGRVGGNSVGKKMLQELWDCGHADPAEEVRARILIRSFLDLHREPESSTPDTVDPLGRNPKANPSRREKH